MTETVGDFLVDRLHAWGVRRIYGYPGDGINGVLGALNRAEEETRRAADLAGSPLQLAVARKQMKEIRELKHSSVRNVEWTKALTVPTLVLSAMVGLMFVFMILR